ncbi:MAG TPA: hypothetical protein VLA50_02375 [Erythrobacter sp.]|nr:hypothetical protein [Erythrobacter sp.]
MARLGRRAKRAKSVGSDPAEAQTTADAKPTGPGGLPLPSPIAGTNLVIADIVLRAAGGLLRNRMEKGLLVASYDKAKADKLVDGRSVATSLALWGASRIATRSPIGLAVVAGGLAAKVFYDRGKRLEAKRRARRRAKPAADSES